MMRARMSCLDDVRCQRNGASPIHPIKFWNWIGPVIRVRGATRAILRRQIACQIAARSR
jgi:hypothetical protein